MLISYANMDEITLNYKTITLKLNSENDQDKIFNELSLKIEPEKNIKKAKKIAKSIAQDIFLYLEKRRLKPAITAMRSMILLVGPDETVEQIKRNGILRSSKYLFNITCVKKFLKELVSNSEMYGFYGNHINFFKSVFALYEIAIPLNALYNSITQRLIKNQRYVVKSLLVEVDSCFIYGITPRAEALGLSSGWTPEEVSEGYSYLIKVFNSLLGVKADNFNFTDPNSGYENIYLKLLNDAVTLCQYKEFEVMIESFPYQARIQSGELVIEATDPSVERSIRIGYTQSDIQLNIRRENFAKALELNPEIASIRRFAEKFFSGIGENLVRLVDKPIRRYVLAFPMYQDVAEIFREDKNFAEDASMLEFIGKEDYVSASHVKNLPVVEDITVMDILKFQRLMTFLHVGIMLAIEKHPKIWERVELQMVSCIPVYKTNALVENLEQVIGKGKAIKILKIMSCDFAKEFVDIQYTPIITSGEFCMFSLAIFTSSNLVRNLLVHHNRRLTLHDKDKRLTPDEKAEVDPMQEKLLMALKEANFLVKDEFDPGSKAKPCEMDLIAYKDGNIFIFECKNSYHPCNVFERRTTYNYIKYASTQLNLRKTWMSDEKNQRAALKKLEWDVPPTKKIHTCIALSNRIFNGLFIDGNQVRSVYELLNVLSEGTIALGSEKFSIWESDKLLVTDFIKQLGPDSTVADFADSMFNIHRKIFIGKTSMNFNTLNIDFEKLSVLVRSRYRKIN